MTLLLLLIQSQLGLEAASWHQRYYNHNDVHNNSSRWTTTTAPVTSTASGIFVFRDCGRSRERPVRVLDVEARPSPLRTPGRVKLSALVNVTADLPTGLNADVLVSKSVLGLHLKIPCYRNIGSCHYDDICGLLGALFPTDRYCPRVLRRHSIRCRCPFKAGLLDLARYTFRVPRFTGFMKTLAIGEYEVMVRLYSDFDHRELGCVQLRFDMKEKRRKRSATMRRRRKRKHVLPSAE